MPITPSHIRDTLDEYGRAHPEDRGSLRVALDLLDRGVDLSDRTEFRGHATAGALLVTRGGAVLQLRHRALDRWLFPGGHLESTDDTLIDAARRELTEETGIVSAEVEALAPRPIHVDVHPIPANPAKREPAHRHIDVRFAFRTDAPVGALQWDEVTDHAWRDLGDIDDVLARRLSAIL